MIVTIPGYLQALGEWGSVHNISEHYWDGASPDTRNRMATMATTSAWHTHKWEAMEKYTNLLPREVMKLNMNLESKTPVK